jgi:predicted phosphoribosyltransferase
VIPVSTPVAPRDAMEDLLIGADESVSIESEDDFGLDSLLSEFGLN